MAILEPSEPSERLIVALDVPSAAEALSLADSLAGVCTWVKVGLELFIAAGPVIVADLKACGFSVFLDLKLHDIPNTVAGAVRSAAATGADMLTVHAAGGPAMLASALDAAESSGRPIQLLGVTVLTSMDAVQLASVGVPASSADQVALLARVAIDSGLRGLVCSPREVASLRRILSENIHLVTPGIRPAGSAAQDQKRIATPAQAISDGATYLVVGRPITQAPNPRAAAQAIQLQITEATTIHQ
jgi:orotidine-5'-phosphate decarboxylase